MKRIDLTGNVFGKLTVIGFSHMKSWSSYWKCKCECGNIAITASSHLKRGTTKSCGCLMGWNKLPQNVAIRNRLLSRYKSKAKVRNLCWKLTDIEADKLFDSSCFYCKLSPFERTNKQHKAIYRANGIDRLNSNNGYEIDNCVPCCTLCNRAKMDMSIQDFSSWVLRLIKTNCSSYTLSK